MRHTFHTVNKVDWNGKRSKVLDSLGDTFFDLRNATTKSKTFKKLMKTEGSKKRPDGAGAL
jgi:hypothetical protein